MRGARHLSWRVSGQLPHSGRLSIYSLDPTRRGREPEASEPFVLPSWAIAPSGNYAVVDDRAHMPNVIEPTKLCIRDDPVWEFRSCHWFLLDLVECHHRRGSGVSAVVAGVTDGGRHRDAAVLAALGHVRHHDRPGPAVDTPTPRKIRSIESSSQITLYSSGAVSPPMTVLRKARSSGMVGFMARERAVNKVPRFSPFRRVVFGECSVPRRCEAC